MLPASVNLNPSRGPSNPVAAASTNAEKKAEAVSLEDENVRLKEQRTCKVCIVGEVRSCC